MPARRYCSNCRAELPDQATSCPACGVYAGDLFDGRIRRERRGGSVAILTALLVVTAAGSAWLALRRSDDPPHTAAATTTPPRVVGDRPGVTRRGAGATISEPEAILTLRRHLVAQRSIASNCIAILSNGYIDGFYTFTTVNHCEATRLGKWRVHGQSRDVVPGWGGPSARRQPPAG